MGTPKRIAACGAVIVLAIACTTWASEPYVLSNGLGIMCMDSPPLPKAFAISAEPIGISQTAVALGNVPTSTWTYGCSATSAGMLFGYYDRTGYSNMYTGPANGGVAPLSDLGQGIGAPITGSCSLIATQNGFDGRVTPGHVDDYWISTNSTGPDPWVTAGRVEHTWGGCLADYMGTNQWKWDFGAPAGIDSNIDGGTTYFYDPSGAKLSDYTPPANQGLPQTELAHGLRLFAESRGYTVVSNYTQLTDNVAPSGTGFTFADFMAEIDAGRPVLLETEGSNVGHTMLGYGYDANTTTVLLHDTWDNLSHSMTWTGSYSGYNLEIQAVTVLELAPVPEPASLSILAALGIFALRRRQRA
jgi:hypothetical protein